MVTISSVLYKCNGEHKNKALFMVSTANIAKTLRRQPSEKLPEICKKVRWNGKKYDNNNLSK